MFFQLLLVLCSTVNAEFHEKNYGLDFEFHNFKTRFAKTYATASEEAARKSIFASNLNRMTALNALEKGSEYPPYGITTFMDLSPDEFKQRLGLIRESHTGLNMTKPVVKHLTLQQNTSQTTSFPCQLQTIRDKPGVEIKTCCPGKDCSPMQYQGACKDCWAFTASEVIETATAARTGNLTRLSPQEIIDCFDKSITCKTFGNLADGFIFAYLNGLEPLSSYPITNVDGNCSRKQASTGRISGYADAGSGNEQTMLNNFGTHGPIAVAVDARNWQFYDGGKYNGNPGCTPITNCGTDVDHAVSIVGYYSNTNQVGVNGWVIRNHWGIDWGCKLKGEGGYALLPAGSNTCGISSQTFMVTGI